MPLTLTAVLFGIAAVAFGVSVWMDRRPYEPGKPWRFPAKLVMALALLALLMLGGHLVTLLSGHPFKGRSGF